MTVTVKGWAARPERDRIGHIVVPTAFDASIAKVGLGGPKGIKFLWHHKVERVIGRITKLESRNSGLWLEGEIDDAEAEKALENNGPLNFSIGFFPEAADISDDERSLIITEGTLFEVSAVTIPMNEEAVMTEVTKQ